MPEDTNSLDGAHIRGIDMFDKTAKNTMFADDCTIIIDGSEQSYNTTVYLFEEFGKLSCLNLNFSNCPTENWFFKK